MQVSFLYGNYPAVERVFPQEYMRLYHMYHSENTLGFQNCSSALLCENVLVPININHINVTHMKEHFF